MKSVPPPAVIVTAVALLSGAGVLVSEADKVVDTVCHDGNQAAYNQGMSDQIAVTIEQTARLSAARVALQCYRTAAGSRSASRKCDAVLKTEEAAALDAVAALTRKAQ